MLGWRRVTEAVLQRTPVSFTSKNFKATSNARNEAMFKEATEFSLSIKVLEKDLKSLLKYTDIHFKNLRCILVSPLPRIYDWGPNGQGLQPLDDEPRLLGANMEVEGIPRAAEEARKRIQAEVLNPLHEWLNIYKQVSERMKVLEEKRLVLDSRRRTVVNLHGDLERAKSNQGRHDSEEKMRKLSDTIVRKQTKLEASHQLFLEMEDTLYGSLYVLVRDAVVLRDYTHCSLNIIQEAYLAAAKAYDTLPTTAQSTTALGTYSQPENKYEAQLPGSGRATPRGLSGFIDRLRGKGSKVPMSPSTIKDAEDHPDQVAYGYKMYGASQRMPSAYMGQQGQSMRPTHESDAPLHGNAYQQGGLSAQPSTNNYIQPANPAAYMPANTAPYQPTQYAVQQAAKYTPQAGGYPGQQPGQRGLSQMNSIKYASPADGSDYASGMPQGRYGGPPQQAAPQQHQGPVSGWTQDGY